MKAMILKEANAKFSQEEIPLVKPKNGEVVVRIKASGINPLDLKIYAGKADHAKVKLPAVLGMDLAGVIEEVGPGVTTFKVGDEVLGMAGGIGGLQGTLAEFLTVDSDFLAKKSKKTSMQESAATPLIFITAWEGLVDRAQVKSGQTVLVHGGAGGVGHMAVQIAKAFGAKVFATGSSGQKEIIEGFGATFIDYTTTSVDEYVKTHTQGEGFDIVYDTVGGQTLDASFVAAKVYTGHVVSCLGWGTHSLAPLSFRGATYSGVFTLLPMLTGRHRKHHGDILAQASRLADEGKLKVLLDHNIFKLEDVDKAYALIEAGQSRGKVVIHVQS